VAPEAWSWVALGGRGAVEVVDGADSWGPIDRETRERQPARKARTKS
jgi:hypothetical protein